MTKKHITTTATVVRGARLAIEMVSAVPGIISTFFAEAWELGQLVEVHYGDKHGIIRVHTLHGVLADGLTKTTLSRIAASLAKFGRRLKASEMKKLAGGRVRKLDLQMGDFKPEVEAALLPLLSSKELPLHSRKASPAVGFATIKQLGLALAKIFFGLIVALASFVVKTWRGTRPVAVRYGQHVGVLRTSQLHGALDRGVHDIGLMRVKASLASNNRDLSVDECRIDRRGGIRRLNLEAGAFNPRVEGKLLRLLSKDETLPADGLVAPKKMPAAPLFAGVYRLPLSFIVAVADCFDTLKKGIEDLLELREEVNIQYGAFSGTISVAEFNWATEEGVSSTSLSRLQGSLAEKHQGQHLSNDELITAPGGRIRGLNVELGLFNEDVEARLLSLLEKTEKEEQPEVTEAVDTVEVTYGDVTATISVVALESALEPGNTLLSRVQASLKDSNTLLGDEEMTSEHGKILTLNLKQGAFKLSVEERLLPLLKKSSTTL